MNSFRLKMIAMLTMLIDHIGHSLLEYGGMEYYVFRAIGRLAFPIFTFLLAEGYFHTRDVKKYILRLFAFALISEAPFDLMCTSKPWSLSQQNVFFTLAISLAAIWLLDNFARRDEGIPALLTMLAAGLVLYFMKADYGIYGLMLVFIFYRFRGDKRGLALFFILAVLLNAMDKVPKPEPMLLVRLAALAALPLIFSYNGAKGYGNKLIKYTFYMFYPVHMLVVYALAVVL